MLCAGLIQTSWSRRSDGPVQALTRGLWQAARVVSWSWRGDSFRCAYQSRTTTAALGVFLARYPVVSLCLSCEEGQTKSPPSPYDFTPGESYSSGTSSLLRHALHMKSPRRALTRTDSMLDVSPCCDPMIRLSDYSAEPRLLVGRRTMGKRITRKTVAL